MDELKCLLIMGGRVTALFLFHEKCSRREARTVKRTKVIKCYSDVVLKRIVKKNEKLEVCEASAEYLVKEGMAGLIGEGKQAKAEGITEQLKEENSLEWTGRLNNKRACAKEIIEEEIILK